MANNRLYMGHLKTKTWTHVTNGWGHCWESRAYNDDTVKNFICDNEILEGNCGNLTGFVFFSEYDLLYDWFMNHGEEYNDSGQSH